jgi:hypothetical protein
MTITIVVPPPLSLLYVDIFYALQIELRKIFYKIQNFIIIGNVHQNQSGFIGIL